MRVINKANANKRPKDSLLATSLNKQRIRNSKTKEQHPSK